MSRAFAVAVSRFALAQRRPHQEGHRRAALYGDADCELSAANYGPGERWLLLDEVVPDVAEGARGARCGASTPGGPPDLAVRLIEIGRPQPRLPNFYFRGCNRREMCLRISIYFSISKKRCFTVLYYVVYTVCILA